MGCNSSQSQVLADQKMYPNQYQKALEFQAADQKGCSQEASDQVEGPQIQNYPMPTLLNQMLTKVQPVINQTADDKRPACAQCPGGHHLQPFSSDENGWNCNCCQKIFPIGTTLHGCRKCNYDICSKCVKHQQAFCVGEVVERRDKGKEWRMGYVTSVTPLKVSFSDKGSCKDGMIWDEVRKR